MSTGPSLYLLTEYLDALGNAGAFSVTTAYLQLHTGDPGANGTANVAGNATRKAVSFGAAASGVIASDADIVWSTSEVDTSEDYTHWSLFDASSAGNFLGSGTITANPVTSGDTFTLPSGSVEIDWSAGAAA